MQKKWIEIKLNAAMQKYNKNENAIIEFRHAGFNCSIYNNKG